MVPAQPHDTQGTSRTRSSSSSTPEMCAVAWHYGMCSDCEGRCWGWETAPQNTETQTETVNNSDASRQLVALTQLGLP